MIVRRVVSVYLPTWPVDRIRRRDPQQQSSRGARAEPPVLLLASDHGRRIVACCCTRSMACGVRPGMTLAHARALIGRDQAIEAEHEPQRDEAALRRLAAWAVRFTPLVAVDPPDALLLDVRGCAHLYGGERGLLNAIGNGLERLGIANRLGCAGTIGCAWAVARFDHRNSRRRSVVEPGMERAAIEPLPIESLRLDDQTIAALHEVNVDHVAEVLAIPRLELAARFSGLLLLRIDQALGETAEVIESIRPHQPIVAERIFDGAVVNLESLLIVTRELVEEVAAALVRQESGATRLDMTLKRLDATPIRMALRLSHPSRDGRHLESLLRPRVEAVNMGFGIEQITLVATAMQRVAHEQQEHWNNGSRSGAAADRAAAQLIDTLSHRLGAQRTVVMRVVESHQPQRVAQYTPAITAGTPPPPAATPAPAAAIVDEDRPSLLLEHPEPIDVMAVTPEGPPIWLRWRGTEHRIATTSGPQRISDEWWDRWRDGWGDAPRRAEHRDRDPPRREESSTQTEISTKEYFKVQDESGRWLWIYRESSGRWFVHGEWA